MTPPTCGRIVTVEYGITWPTGGGLTSTGTLVSTAGATNTGAPAPSAPFFTPPEQPLTNIVATTASAGIRVEFFMPFSMCKIDFAAAVARGLERSGKFSQKFRVLLLKMRIGNRPAHDKPRQLGERHRKHRQRPHRDQKVARFKFAGQIAERLLLADAAQCPCRQRPPAVPVNQLVVRLLQRLPFQQANPVRVLARELEPKWQALRRVARQALG